MAHNVHIGVMELVEKVDLETDPKTFWKETGRMRGRNKKARERSIKNENGVVLGTDEESERDFRNRLEDFSNKGGRE